MTTLTTTTKALVVTAAVALLAACGGGSDGDKSQTGRLKLSITDAPMDDVQEVWVKFSAVEFKPEGGAPVLSALTPAQSLELLGLRDGRSAVLVNNLILPAGRYEWIRLVVDNVPNMRDSYVMANGAECELTVPSGAESGLKMNRGFTLPADGSVALTVDFDLRKSLHAPPGQKSMMEMCTQGYLLRPTLRLVQDSEVGAIAGTVAPALFQGIAGCVPRVYVFSDGTSAAGSTLPDDQDANEPNPVVMATPNADTGDYKATFLTQGNYTVAYTCNGDKDDPANDDSALVVFSADKKAAVVQPNLITQVNFAAPTP
jgi:Domain of unknown function (DUF4382)